MLLGMRALEKVAPQWVGPAWIVLLVYVIYSWVWPPIFRRWMMR